MTFQAWQQTDPGLRRERNEDSVLIDAESGIFVVADGMGGHRGGEVASKIAVETVVSTLKNSLKNSGARKINPRELLVSAYEEASKRIFEKSQGSGNELQGMGTTMVAGFVYGDLIYIANVGDSRAYLYSHTHLWQMTEDHSLINEQLRAGLITEADLSRVSSRNVITRSVGFERDVHVDILERPFSPGDLYILCSDGLYGMVGNSKIEELCRSHKPSELVPIFISEARKNGGDDNITAVVFYAEPRSS